MKSCCANKASFLRCEALTWTRIEPATVRAERRRPGSRGQNGQNDCAPGDAYFVHKAMPFTLELSRGIFAGRACSRRRKSSSNSNSIFREWMPYRECERDDSQLRPSSGLLS